MTDNNGKWDDGKWDVNDGTFANIREDIQKAVKQINKHGPPFPPFVFTSDEWRVLQEPRDYMSKYCPRPGDSLITRFKKWRKRRQMNRLLKRVKIVDRRIVTTFNNQPSSEKHSPEPTWDINEYRYEMGDGEVSIVPASPRNENNIIMDDDDLNVIWDENVPHPLLVDVKKHNDNVCNKRTLCVHCSGTGNEFYYKYRKCPKCGGKGYVEEKDDD